MFRIIKEFQFCYGHRLLGYAGKCAHLHGHNAVVEVEVQAEVLDNDGMVEDFAHLRDALGNWLSETLDHKMILSTADPLAEVLKKQGEPVYLLNAPPTAENICREIFENAKALGFNVVRTRFWEQSTSSAVYEIAA